MGEDETAAGVRTTLALAMAAPAGSVTWPRRVTAAAGAAVCGVGVCGAAVCVPAVCVAPRLAHNCSDKRTSARKRYFRNIIPLFHSAKSLSLEVKCSIPLWQEQNLWTARVARGRAHAPRCK